MALDTEGAVDDGTVLAPYIANGSSLNRRGRLQRVGVRLET